jgi:hypothetical protein
VNPPPEAPEPNFNHVIRMTDERGTFEHALFGEPRTEHGYCTDDMARVLVVATSEPDPRTDVRDLAMLSVQFLLEALDAQGKCRNRLDRNGIWEDVPTLNDCWGRSIWGLGTAASRSDDQLIRALSTDGFERAARQRSPWPRAMSFAALGAANLLGAEPDNKSARDLLSNAADAMVVQRHQPDWPWPERRLTYANAILPEAMIAAGSALDRPPLLQRGLELLDWLLARETRNGHLSVTPVGGSGPGDREPGYDQQPIEVAALADACARAFDVDGHSRWMDGVTSARNWFLGDNDTAVVMWDPHTGGGFDGLQEGGANRNQGTESTLAFLSTMQHARHSDRILQ